MDQLVKRRMPKKTRKGLRGGPPWGAPRPWRGPPSGALPPVGGEGKASLCQPFKELSSGVWHFVIYKGPQSFINNCIFINRKLIYGLGYGLPFGLNLRNHRKPDKQQQQQNSSSNSIRAATATDSSSSNKKTATATDSNSNRQQQQNSNSNNRRATATTEAQQH
ncbi:hypothetical protein ACSSS7_003523 [Eimeria intestinalis]